MPALKKLLVIALCVFLAAPAAGDGVTVNGSLCGGLWAAMSALPESTEVAARESLGDHLGNALANPLARPLKKWKDVLAETVALPGSGDFGVAPFFGRRVKLHEITDAAGNRFEVGARPAKAKDVTRRQVEVFGQSMVDAVAKPGERRTAARQVRGADAIEAFLDAARDGREVETDSRKFAQPQRLFNNVPGMIPSTGIYSIFGLITVPSFTIVSAGQLLPKGSWGIPLALGSAVFGVVAPFIARPLWWSRKKQVLNENHTYDAFESAARAAVKAAGKPNIRAFEAPYLGFTGHDGRKYDLLLSTEHDEPVLSIFVTGDKPLPAISASERVLAHESKPAVVHESVPEPVAPVAELPPAVAHVPRTDLASRARAVLVGGAPAPLVAPAEAATSVARLATFFGQTNGRLAERERVLGAIERSLIAREHVLLLGPGGTAKSYLSDLLFENIHDGEGTSYGRLFLNEGTTTNQTHGPYSPRALSADQYKRLYDQGLAKYRRLLLDELFDPSPMVQRSLMELLNERRLSDGNHVEKAALETAVAATNQLMAEVYRRGGASSMAPVFDRFGAIYYVDGDLGLIKSIKKIGAAGGATPHLNEEDLRRAQALAETVEVPEELRYAAYWVNMTMKDGAGKLNEGWAREALNAPDERPASHTTRTYSLRFYGKSLKMLKAEVVRDLARDPSRPLSAKLSDLDKLEDVFTMGAVDTASLTKRKGTGEPAERQQKATILAERELFQKTMATLKRGIENAPETRAVNEWATQLTGEKHEEAKHQLLTVVEKSHDLRRRIQEEDLAIEELTPQNLAILFSGRRAKEALRGVFP